MAARLGAAQELLGELIAAPSPPGAEGRAMDVAAAAFAEWADVRRVELSDALRDDADYSDPIPDLHYEGRSNLRVCLPGRGGGRTLLLNTHLDTVPPGEGQERPFEPRVRDGCVFGRGACDAKGQVATIYLAMAALKDLGAVGGDLIAHLVVEEEVGGNGTLAMVRAGEAADACVVLEPTDLKVLRSIRGAVWFRLTLRGESGHSGRPGGRRSALQMAGRVVEVLRGYHDRLLDESRGDPLFDRHPDPMPLTIGTLHAGNWPAAAPGRAVLEGVLGLLRNKTAQQVMDEMTAAIRDEGGPDLADNLDIHFTYRHDASVVAGDHPLVAALESAAGAAGRPAEIDAMTASCDAWFYNNQLGIPTVVFGGGSLGTAHSNGERMPLSELAAAAEILVHLVLGWCRQESP